MSTKLTSLPFLSRPGVGIDEDNEGSMQDAVQFISIDTNNSMPLADKAYDPPEMPEEISAHLHGLGDAAKAYRETFRPMKCDFITVFLRLRRKHYESLLWQLLSIGVVKKKSLYMAECLPFWTIGIKMRLRNNCPMGRLMEAMKCRLGITNPGLRFCIDGFFGMVNYTDIFGNVTDACPWMVITNFSTVNSLRLQDGDSIFVSVASPGQIENVLKYRKRQVAEAGAKPPPSPTSGPHPDDFTDDEEPV